MSVRGRDYYFRVITGKQRGIVAGAARAGLTAESIVYRLLIRIRQLYYRVWPWSVKRVGRPVICVGNLTTGGTGKTPMAAWIAQRLSAEGVRVGLVTRGYRGRAVQYRDDRAAEAAGQWRVESDEAMLLARLCPAAEVVIDADRVGGARRAIERGAEALVLDDGFQHFRLGRDLNVVLVDATCPLGYGHLLPRGLLREPVGGLRRAGVIVVTRSEAVDSSERVWLASRLRRWSGGRPVLFARHRVTGFVTVSGRPVTDASADAMQAVIFAGVGQFGAFRRTVEGLGVRVLAAYEYPDHHYYTAEEIAAWPEAASRLDANVLLTTEKDAVRLTGRWADGAIRLLAVRVEIDMDEEDGKMLLEAIHAATAGKPSRRSRDES
jgi:tetraacyldisaccharide 4'-kinase